MSQMATQVTLEEKLEVKKVSKTNDVIQIEVIHCCCGVKKQKQEVENCDNIRQVRNGVFFSDQSL